MNEQEIRHYVDDPEIERAASVISAKIALMQLDELRAIREAVERLASTLNWDGEAIRVEVDRV